jgi:DNA-binding response OmpR family regulator
MTAESNPKVLIADDEHIIADTLVMILDKSGFDALRCTVARRRSS